jgi:hypothetical protein
MHSLGINYMCKIIRIQAVSLVIVLVLQLIAPILCRFAHAPFRNSVHLCELRLYEADVDSCSVEYVLIRWNGDSQVGVLRQACDEEHEAAGFDLQFGKVGASCWDTEMFSVIYQSLK